MSTDPSIASASSSGTNTTPNTASSPLASTTLTTSTTHTTYQGQGQDMPVSLPNDALEARNAMEALRSGKLHAALARQDRLTVQLTIYHEHQGEQPESVLGNWSRLLGTKEQPYKRRRIVGEEWLPLDSAQFKGWIEEPGLLVIQNRQGSDRVINPTKEDLEEDELHELLISWEGLTVEPLCVPARATIPFYIKTLEGMRIRSAKGDTPVIVTLYPR